MEDERELEDYTFVGVSTEQEIIFDNVEPRLILIDVFQPIVKLENCVWLEEQ